MTAFLNDDAFDRLTAALLDHRHDTVDPANAVRLALGEAGIFMESDRAQIEADERADMLAADKKAA